MEHQEASTILIELLEKNIFSAEEKEAISTAIGVLAWTSLAKNKIKSIGEKRKKKLENGI